MVHDAHARGTAVGNRNKGDKQLLLLLMHRTSPQIFASFLYLEAGRVHRHVNFISSRMQRAGGLVFAVPQSTQATQNEGACSDVHSSGRSDRQVRSLDMESDPRDCWRKVEGFQNSCPRHQDVRETKQCGSDEVRPEVSKNNLRSPLHQGHHFHQTDADVGSNRERETEHRRENTLHAGQSFGYQVLKSMSSLSNQVLKIS